MASPIEAKQDFFSALFKTIKKCNFWTEIILFFTFQVIVQRSDTPDSAVTDLHSIPTSTDSPSSSSPVSCNGDNSHGLLLDNVGTSIKSMTMTSIMGLGGRNGLKDQVKVTIATQTGIEEADRGFDISKLSVDPHCYECKVKYRDPRPKDLVMFLHAWTYSVSKNSS